MDIQRAVLYGMTKQTAQALAEARYLAAYTLHVLKGIKK